MSWLVDPLFNTLKGFRSYCCFSAADPSDKQEELDLEKGVKAPLPNANTSDSGTPVLPTSASVTSDSIKGKKKDTGDDSDDETASIEDKKKQPSKIKQATVVITGTAATLICNYLKANPLITIPLAALSASSCKSALRNVPRKIRYTTLTTAVGLGFAVDYLILPPNITLNLGPTALVYLISIAGRTSKLWVLGKGAKDQ